jgi:hypothetical protein
MKTLHLLWLLALAPVSVSAQGQINFATIGVGVNAPITNQLTGQRVPAGNTLLAQLYYGPAGITDPWSLISVTNPAVGFAVDGFVIAGTRLTEPAVVAGGQVGTFQVRVWEASLGTGWEQAYQSWISLPDHMLVWSSLIQVKTTIAPDSPPYLTGLPPIYLPPVLVPEPTTIALGLLGAGVLLWWGKCRRQPCGS